MSDVFKVKSEALKGDKAKDTIKAIAYMIARQYDMDTVEDVINALSTGLDGGPERFRDNGIYIIKELINNKESLNTERLSLRIKELVMATEGWFSYENIDRELGIISQTDKANRRKVIFRMVHEGLIERHPELSGKYRKATQALDKLSWQDADVNKIKDIRWPFALETMVTIYPKSIIVIAGSPNAGKTCFLLNFIELNMKDHNIHYFTSEMGPEELKLRISKFDIPMTQWRFQAYERASQFARVIKPDDINVIDYLEIGDNFFTIADEFREIFDNLNTGIAVIALQKKFGASMGRGAEFGMEKPRLYLTIDNGELVIQKAKNWATKDNPNKKKIRFKLVDGAKFIEQGRDDNVPF